MLGDERCRMGNSAARRNGGLLVKLSIVHGKREADKLMALVLG